MLIKEKKQIKNQFYGILCHTTFLFLFFFMSCNPQEVETFNIDVTVVNPDQGSTVGGETITFEGAGLSYLKKIKIADEECTDLKIISDSMATCRTPPHEVGAVEITLINLIDESYKQTFTYTNSPTISSIEPRFGPIDNNSTAVLISGSAFEQGVKVTFGGEECPIITSDDSKIVCVVPSSSKVGYVQTVIENPSGKKISGNYFSYRNPPTVSKVSPAGGNPSGGTLLTINGTGFMSGIKVYVGSYPCNNVSVLGSGTLTCVTSAGSDTKDVTVKFEENLKGVKSSAFSYINPPVITDFNPKALPAEAPANDQSFLIKVNVTGADIVSKIKIGSMPCIEHAYDLLNNMITCHIKGGFSGPQKITVTNSYLQSAISEASFTFRPTPVITSVTPEILSTKGEEEIIIKGSNFVVDEDINIKIGTVSCVITEKKNYEVRCKTPPAGLIHGMQTLTMNLPISATAVSNNTSYNHTVSKVVRVMAPPKITKITPSSGRLSGGTLVTINGENFSEADMVVTFNDIPCTNLFYQDATTVKCRTPSGSAAGSALVEVKDALGQYGTESVYFLYKDAPSIVSLSPNKGRTFSQNVPKVLVTITGTNFNNESIVTIGGSECEITNVPDSTKITCYAPDSVNSKEGPVDVIVTNSDNQSALLASGYNYQDIILDWFEVGVTTQFGNVSSNIFKKKTFTIKNSIYALSSSSLAAPTISSSHPNAWVITGGTCYENTSLAPGGACTVEVTFDPSLGSLTAGTNSSATLQIKTDNGAIFKSLSLTASVTEPLPELIP